MDIYLQILRLEKRIADINKRMDAIDKLFDLLPTYKTNTDVPQPTPKEFVVVDVFPHTRSIYIACNNIDAYDVNRFGKLDKTSYVHNRLEVSKLYDFDEVVAYLRKYEH